VNETALIAALGAALGFAISSPLQHHAAAKAPPGINNARHLLPHLVRRPWWLVGQVLALASFFLHAYALHAGALALVQPIVVSGIVFAVPIRAALSRKRPPPGEIRAVLVTAAGLGTFLVAAGSMVGTRTLLTVGGVFVAVGVLVAGGVFVLAGMSTTAALRAGLYGVTAGILFGMVAGCVKLALGLFEEHGLMGVLTGWPTWVLIPMGISGVAINQRAYRVGALSASMPVLNIVNVLVALTFGVIVLGEIPAHDPGPLVAELVGLACIALGLVQLSAHADLDVPTPV
jgi:hypothetical protein